MKIYLASGFSVMSKEGREEELYKKFGRWNRLMSYYLIKEAGGRCQILDLIKKLKSKKSRCR